MQNKTKGNEPSSREESLGAMRIELNVLRAKVHAAKVAYLNRTPFQEREVSFEDLKAIATEYIRKSYEYQKAVYGRVRVRISVAKLLRQR